MEEKPSTPSLRESRARAWIPLAAALLAAALAGCGLFPTDDAPVPDPSPQAEEPADPPVEPPVEPPVQPPASSARILAVLLTPPEGPLAAGGELEFAVVFERAMTVTGGPPILLLSNGRSARYESGSGSATLRFRARFQEGDDASALSLAIPPRIDPRGGTIRDAAGIDADPRLPADPLEGRAVSVDTRPPGVGIVPVTSGDRALFTISGWVDEPVAGVSIRSGERIAAATVSGLSWTLPGAALGPFVPGAHDLSAAATDAAGNVGWDTTSDEVTILDRPPVAAELSVATDEDMPVALRLSGADPDGDPLVFEVVVPPRFGALSGTPPELSYSPAADRNGADEFFYLSRASGIASTPARVAIEVRPVDDPPILSPLPDLALDEDAASPPIVLSLTDVDTPRAAIAIVADADDATLLPSGSLRLSGMPEAPRLTVVPAPDRSGSARVTVRARDALSGAEVSFALAVAPVNDPPRIGPVPTVSLTAAQPVAAVPVELTDPDDDAASLSLSVQVADPSLLSVPPAVSGTPDARTVTFAAASATVGSTTATLTVSDGKAQMTRTFTLLVDVPDTPPALDLPATFAIDEDTVAGPIPVAVSDPETPAADLRLFATCDRADLLPAEGIVFGGTGGTRTLTLTPAPDAHGEALLLVTVEDGDLTASKELRLTLRPVNDPPRIAAPSAVPLREDDPPVAFAFTVEDPDDPSDALLVAARFEDPSLFPPASATVSGSGATRTLSLEPLPDRFGATALELSARDGEAETRVTVPVTVASVNDPPRLDPVADLELDRGGSAGPIPLPLSDPDTPAEALTLAASVDGGPLAAASLVFGGAGGSRTMTLTAPAEGFGVSRVTLALSDGALGATRTFTVTVRDVVPPPDPARIRYRAPANSLALSPRLDGARPNTRYRLAARLSLGGRAVELVSRGPLPDSGELPLSPALFALRSGDPDDLDASPVADDAVTRALVPGVAFSFGLIGAESGVEGTLVPDGALPAPPNPATLAASAARGVVTSSAPQGGASDALLAHQAAGADGAGARLLGTSRPADATGELLGELILAPGRHMIYSILNENGHESPYAADGTIPLDPSTSLFSLSAARSLVRVRGGTLAPAGETLRAHRFNGAEAFLFAGAAVDGAGAPRPGPYAPGQAVDLRDGAGGLARFGPLDLPGFSLVSENGNESDIALGREVPAAPVLAAAGITNQTGAVEVGATPLLADAGATILRLYHDDDGVAGLAGTALHRESAAAGHAGTNVAYPLDRSAGQPAAWTPVPAGRHLALSLERADGDESPLSFAGAMPAPPAGASDAEGDLARLSLSYASASALTLRDARGLSLPGARDLLVSLDDGATWRDLAAVDSSGSLVRKAGRVPLAGYGVAARVRYAWRNAAGHLSLPSAVDGAVVACAGFGDGTEIAGPSADARIPMRFTGQVRILADLPSAAAIVSVRLAAGTARGVVFGEAIADLAAAEGSAPAVPLAVGIDGSLDADETGWAFLPHPDANVLASADGGHAPAPAANLPCDFHTPAWRPFDAAGPGAGGASSLRLALDALGSPWLAYRDAGAGGRVTVAAHDGVAWATVGPAGFADPPLDGPAFALDPFGGAWVAVGDGGAAGRATVHRHDGTAWTEVGGRGFTAGAATLLSLAADGYGRPFLAFRDGAADGRMTVLFHDGLAWNPVGEAGFTPGRVDSLALAVDGAGRPVVAFADAADGGRASALRHDGTSWRALGAVPLSLGAASSLRVALDAADRPLVAFLDAGDAGRASVLRFDGAAFSPVGARGATASAVEAVDLALDRAGRPLLFFADPAHGGRGTALVHDGSAWAPLGAPGFTASAVAEGALAVDPLGEPFAAYPDDSQGGRLTVARFR